MGGVKIVVLRLGECFHQYSEAEQERMIVFSGSPFIPVDVDSDEWTHGYSDPPRVGIYEHLPPSLAFDDGREQFFLDFGSAFISSDKEKIR